MSDVNVAESSDYVVIVEPIKSSITLDGNDTAYSIVNRKTDVVEVRSYTLPEALMKLQYLQGALDAAQGKTGSVN